MGAQARERCLNQCIRAVGDGLQMGPGLRRKIWMKGTEWALDEERLRTLVEPLPVLEPRSAAERLDQMGGLPFLRTQGAQTAVRDWGIAHRILELLRWFSLAISAAMRAYREGILSTPAPVLRSLPVLAMSGFLPWSQELWKDVSSILGARAHDTLDMLRRYRQALHRGDEETLLAVDARVCSDADWGCWACAFPDLLAEASGPWQVATTWEFPDTDQTRYNGILRWLFRRE